MAESTQEPVPQQTSIRTQKRSFMAKRFHESKYLLLLFIPTILYFTIFEYGPMFGILVAFKEYNLFRGVWESPWVGFKYFELFIFENPDFLKLLRNTFLLGFYSLLFAFPAPIILALLLNELRNVIFKRFVQSISYIPHFLSNVIVVGMVLMFLSPDNGLLNQLLDKMFGTEPIYFMSIPELFRSVYVSSGIWQGIGWGSIIYLAAIAGIDPHLYEVASIDGAGRWKQMRHVTLPGIAPVIIIMLIFNIGGLLGTGFEKVYLLATPLVYETADIFSTYTYRIGLENGNFSYATAIGTFNSIVSFILMIGANYVARKTQETSLW